MKRILLLMIVATLARGAGAQSTADPAATVSQGTANAPDAATPAQSSGSFPSGTTIPVELSKSLDTKKAKVGDKIEARIPADLLAHGKIVIPRSAKILGQVTEVKAHSKESPDSRVGVTFDRLVMKDGREVSLHTVVQAIGRPLQLVAASDAHMNEGAGTPAATASTAGGSGMGASMPSRSAERVGAVPIDAGSGSEAASTMAPLGPTSQGVVGMKALALNVSGTSSVVSSATDNVHLESGTQLILRVQ
jgi:hypothetical protein